MERGARVELDAGRCVACLECLEVCPRSSGISHPVFRVSGEGRPEVAYPESCIFCLDCTVRCRAMAIRVNGRRLPPAPMGDRILHLKLTSMY